MLNWNDWRRAVESIFVFIVQQEHVKDTRPYMARLSRIVLWENLGCRNDALDYTAYSPITSYNVTRPSCMRA